MIQSEREKNQHSLIESDIDKELAEQLHVFLHVLACLQIKVLE